MAKKRTNPGDSRERERPRRGSKSPKPAGRPWPRASAPDPATATAGERLQKALAAAGLGSRRACEELILQGRVTVNNEVVRELGTRVQTDAKIEVDGVPVKRERMVYLAVSKPKGYVSTNDDPSGRPRVVDLVADVPERVYTVGRLDEDSTGLILLTNDGDLANRLAHPRYGVEKVYRAIVAGHPEPAVIEKLEQGVWLAEGKARARRVRVVGSRGDATIVEMVLAEGKNREVRRMWAKFGHKVMSLQRVCIGPVTVKGLKTGEYRPLTSVEVAQLRDLAAGKRVATAWFGEENDRRQAPLPRRGPARHQAKTPATGTRGRASASGSTSAAEIKRPMGPRAMVERAPRPMGPRLGPGAGPRGPRGPAGLRPPRPRPERDTMSGPLRSGPRRPPVQVEVDEIEILPDAGGGRPRRPGGPRRGRMEGPPPPSARPGPRVVIGLDAGSVPPPSKRRLKPGDAEGGPTRRPFRRKPKPLAKPRRKPPAGPAS